VEGGGVLLISHEQFPTAKVLAHLGIKSYVSTEPLTDLSACVDFWTSNPQQGVKYQLWYLNFFHGGRGVYKYPMEISAPLIQMDFNNLKKDKEPVTPLFLLKLLLDALLWA
jgi:hypothetical protein